MSTFRYHPMPNPRGGFTTRVVLGERIAEQALVERAAAAAGLTPEQTAAAVQAFLRAILAAAQDTQWCDDLFGLARFTPLSGGSQPEHDRFHTAADLEAGVSLAFTAAALRRWQSTLTLESRGLRGKLTPKVVAVVDIPTGQSDAYTAGGPLLLRGQRLKLDWSDPEQGVFLQREGGPAMRCTSAGLTDPKRLLALVPPEATGTVYLRVVSRRDGTLRTATYSTMLTPSLPAPPPEAREGRVTE